MAQHLPKVFVSYNPKQDSEHTLAVRLHTLGAVNGLRMLLPDRKTNGELLSIETKNRIREADYYVLFAVGQLSEHVVAELNYAADNHIAAGNVIIVYNALHPPVVLNRLQELKFHLFPFNASQGQVDDLLHRIIEVVFEKKQTETLKKENQELRQTQNALLGILGVGAGLLLLNALLKEE
jgi:hypothetical protein